MRYEIGRARLRYALVFALAAVLGSCVAFPVLAAEETTDDGTIQPQVVGGEPVPDGKYRFVASLQDVTQGSTAYRRHYCGGTLIDRDSVLTAAHCVEGKTASRLRIIVGRARLDSSKGQTRRVKRIFRHPNYTPYADDFRYDAAVLKLESRTKNIRPIHIPKTSVNAPEEPGRILRIAGWGKTSQRDTFPERMQEARVPVVSDRQAKSVYDGNYAPKLMVAAGEEGKDTCQGDSGGPMFLKRSGGKVFQIGITSFGAGCGARGYPGVYAETNATEIRPFIMNRAGR